MEVVTVFLPVFAVIILGWLFKSWKFVDATVSEGLYRFARRVAGPALLLLSMGSASWYSIWQWEFVAIIGIPLITLFVIFMYFFKMMTKDGVNASAVSALSLLVSNVGFYGLALMYGIFGRRAMVPMAFAIVIMMAMCAICVMVMNGSKAKGYGAGIQAGLKCFFRDGFIIAIIIGGLYSLSGLMIPAGIAKFLHFLEIAFAPVMLFSIGMTLDARVLEKSFKDIWLAMLIKLVAFPLLIIWICCAYNYTGIWAITAIIIAALPTGHNCCKLAKASSDKKNRFHHMISAMVESTNVAAIVTVFVWLVILAQIFPAEFGRNLSFF